MTITSGFRPCGLPRIMKSMKSRVCHLVVIFFGLLLPRAFADDGLLTQPWKLNGLASPKFQIQGTASRNNPLRQALKVPFSGDELFVRYRIRYDLETIDLPEEKNGEFFVLWLDQVEGNDSSTHSGNIPNVGLHVSGNENRFMVRYASSNQQFGPPLVGDREFVVVARLWKSQSGKSQPFDQLNLWIDPKANSKSKPAASVSHSKSINQVRWIGFSTGVKTEIDDSIDVWDIKLATTWEAILDLPPQSTAPTQPIVKRTIDFAKHVYPILKARCFECHQGKDAKEGVRLDVWDEVLNRTAPRDASKSKLYQLVLDGEMPPGGESLKSEEVATLRAWIDEGLEWDQKLLPTPIPKTTHWAFQPIRRPEVPSVENAEWVRTPIDAFIARQHRKHGLTPAKPANTETLARRMSLDLLGLPPNSSAAPGDVERLLDHPAYGERWGRHWLDVARWAESNGHQHNRHRAYAWMYRDWVVDAFNGDKPFDQFIREQLAGDELNPYSDANIIATGFLAAARYSGNELDKQIQRNDILVDIVNTTASAFLGLTFECAQCHTHKFDPISIRDYYGLQAFFAKGQPGNVVLGKDAKAKSLVDRRWEIFDTVHARLVTIKRRQGIANPIVIPTAVIGGMRSKERAEFRNLDEQIKKVAQAWAFYSPSSSAKPLTIAPHDMRFPLPQDPRILEAQKTALLIRGDVKSPGPNVAPAWPIVFGPTPSEIDKPRTALAKWMTSLTNPLVARVWVNRIWQWHFGRGLVETSSDFGLQGTQPSHPELLDYLASELMTNKWSTKHIHRLILNSSTYQQSYEFNQANADIDPDNKYLWRWKPRRLEAEAIRDCMLAVSGLLDATRGGPSVELKSKRRGIYLRQRRDNLPHQQMLFDGASGNVSCTRRRVSTTALQQLWQLNSLFAQEVAEAMAKRVKSAEHAARLAFGRVPTKKELAHLNQHAEKHGLASICLGLLNSSEFVYIP